MKQTAVEWFSNKVYALFEQYSEGKFDRIELNKLMLETTNEAKEMEEKQHQETWDSSHQAGIAKKNWQTFEQYLEEVKTN